MLHQIPGGINSLLFMGLGKHNPIMCDHQEGELIFEVGGKFYEISHMGGGLFQITFLETL